MICFGLALFRFHVPFLGVRFKHRTDMLEEFPGGVINETSRNLVAL